jgi:hypothetical protein
LRRHPWITSIINFQRARSMPPRKFFGAPRRKVEASGGRIDAPACRVDALGCKLSIPARKLSIQARKLSILARKLSILACKLSIFLRKSPKQSAKLPATVSRHLGGCSIVLPHVYRSIATSNRGWQAV